MPKRKSTLSYLWKKANKYSEKIYKSKFVWLLATIFAFIIINQVVHPLFAPRIASMNIEPIDIRYREDTNDYFTLFKITYNIDVPLIPIFKTIELESPGFRNELYTNKCNIFFLESFYADKPYTSIPEEFRTGWYDISKSDGKIPLKIEPPLFTIKSIEITLFLAEQTTLRETSKGINWWWNYQCIDPSQPYSITGQESQLLGYGKDLKTGAIFKFYEVQVSNLNSLEIKGYKITWGSMDNIDFCDDFHALTMYSENRTDYSYIDLKPKETRKILVLVVAQGNETKNKDIKFNFSSDSICLGAWRKYQESLSH